MKRDVLPKLTLENAVRAVAESHKAHGTGLGWLIARHLEELAEYIHATGQNTPSAFMDRARAFDPGWGDWLEEYMEEMGGDDDH